ncbi:hypothetical protein BKA58DRAFT_448170 [Alternaria rosae]|uniref:uncharacterized protein n=1 Tax=Alternaria rosae TaxID=1187941 RepID=UPI001E8DE832|nr:uncharacterized protein BKA58DRAFT_448170 [Alternaria rosae]KAH6883384.1 hypothetical protein BKA58DRAFT_448170 [Alternaria rosae]
MSTTPSTPAGGATSASASDAESIDTATTKIANARADTSTATATDNPLSPISHPINPDAPSLLTLPGEVRNAAYEALFVYDDPIQVHANNISYLDYHSGSIVAGTALFQSCHQIQHEATGVFYARNVFRLVLPKDAFGRGDFTWAMAWLRMIGKQSSSLRVVQFDISNLLDQDEDLEILPILEYTWKPEHKDMTATLVTPPERLSMGFKGSPKWSANDTTKINKGLNALIADPSNVLRKYWIPNMLLRVKLDTKGSEVYVSYRHNHRGGGNWMTKGRMTISDEDELRLIPPDRKPGICDLMAISSIKKMLFDLVQPPEVEPAFDLTKQTTNINLRSLAGVNHWLRLMIIAEVGDYHSTFELTASTPKYNFATELERFTTIQLRGHPCYFHLYFDLSEHFTLDDVRFDALQLLSAMSPVDRDVQLKIEVRNPLDSETPNQTFTLFLSELKVSVLSCIYNFLKTYPDRAHLPCPSIWTNGWGQAKEATWGDELGLGPLQIPYLDNSHGGVRCIDNTFANTWHPRLNNVAPGNGNTLIEFLRELP